MDVSGGSLWWSSRSLVEVLRGLWSLQVPGVTLNFYGPSQVFRSSTLTHALTFLLLAAIVSQTWSAPKVRY